MEFKVKDITYKNENGKDIQKIIHRELKEAYEYGIIGEKYEGYSNKEIKELDLNVAEYSNVEFGIELREGVIDNKTRIKVYLEKNNGEFVHVGIMPPSLVKQYKEELAKTKEVRCIAKLTGGKYKSCKYYEDDYDEKCEIQTTELNYGLFVTVYFEYENNEEDIESKTQETENVLKNDIKNKSEPVKNYTFYKKWWFWLIIIFLLGVIA